MRTSRTVLVFVALATVVAMLSVGAAGAASSDRATEVASHWTADRIANATPRDLVIDHRGLGYLRGASGDLQPYGHNIAADRSQLRAVPVPMKPPSGAGGGDSDTIAPSVTALDPAARATIGASHTFSAEVTDNVGVRSVTFDVRPSDSNSSQSFSASASGTTWSVTLEGFSDGDWEWRVIAKDSARRGGNTTTTGWVGFSVDTGGTPPPPGGGDVTDADWTGQGDVTEAVGRIYFEMPSNRRLNRWNGYVCSGTAVTDGVAGRSVIITAAHCVYDDANKAFARNVLFIPQQQETTGSGTDTNCLNDPIGCWTPAFGVVDHDWTTRTFPDNIPWDFAYYVVDDSGAHQGTESPMGSLDGTVTELDVAFSSAFSSAFSLGSAADAIGYSYSQDPRLRYCSEALTTESSYGDLWLGSCDLSGGSSGGPWLQPANTGAGPIISVNSWGYTTSPGMAGPILNDQARCLFEEAKGREFFTAADGSEGIAPDC